MKMAHTEEIKVCSWKERQKQEFTDQITTINGNAS
jgi:hypothetical protein